MSSSADDKHAVPTRGHVLVVDDERPIRRLLHAALSTEGYEVSEAGSIQEATARATSARPDLVVLDLGLPDGDGLQVIQQLREWTQVPILVLSVRGHEEDKIAALDAGADDYLTKPFSTGELLARLRVALRRADKPAEEPVVVTGDLEVHLPARTVRLRGQEVHLTATEYALLKLFAVHLGKVLTHRQLLQGVWGPGYQLDTHLLRVNISNLRRKLELDPLKPEYLVTEPGVGYRLKHVPSAPAQKETPLP